MNTIRTLSRPRARSILATLVAIGFTVVAHSSSTPGSLDLTFGDAGTGKLDIWGSTLPTFQQAEAFGAAFQSIAATTTSPPQTYIVAAGRCESYAGESHVCLSRFLTYGIDQGSADPQFGQYAGVAAIPSSMATFTGLSVGISVQTDRKIIVASGCKEPSATTNAFCVARFLPDGILDTSFGDAGTGVVFERAFNRSSMAARVMVQPDGKIVAAGVCNDSAGVADLCVLRLLATGSRDTGFGNAGFAVVPGVGVDKGWALLRQPSDGKLTVSGNCAGDFCAVRLNSNGSVDSGFGIAGRLTTSFGSSDDKVFGAVRQQSGKLVLGGYCRSSTTGLDDICVARYSANGVLDTSFGTAGKTRVSALPGASSRAYGVALQLDDQIVLGGLCGSTAAYSVCWVRLTVNGALDGTFGPSGVLSNVPVYSSPAGGYMNDLKTRGAETMYGVGACFDQNAMNWTMCTQRYNVCKISKWDNCGTALQGQVVGP